MVMNYIVLEATYATAAGAIRFSVQGTSHVKPERGVPCCCMCNVECWAMIADAEAHSMQAHTNDSHFQPTRNARTMHGIHPTDSVDYPRFIY